jgi:hypothetical protein
MLLVLSGVGVGVGLTCGFQQPRSTVSLRARQRSLLTT